MYFIIEYLIMYLLIEYTVIDEDNVENQIKICKKYLLNIDVP